MNKSVAPIINLGEINKCPEQKKQYEFSIAAEDLNLDLVGVKLVSDVAVKLLIALSEEGLFDLKGQLTTKLKLNCGRCLEEIIRDVTYDLSDMYTVGNNPNIDNEDVIVLEDRHLNLLDYIAESIEFAMESKVVCKDDCLGLCQQCGCDLNKGSCSCNEDSVDPRLAVLKNLLKK